MEGARRPRGLPTPTAQPGPRPRPAPRHSRPRPPPGSRQLQPPKPGGSLGWQAGGAEPRQTQPRWRALKNGARRPERRDIFFPLTELFPTSGCPTRYSSHSAALRDPPPPPPPHPIASSPPPLPQPARPFLRLSASKWRQALFGGCSNRTAADSTGGRQSAAWVRSAPCRPHSPALAPAAPPRSSWPRPGARARTAPLRPAPPRRARTQPRSRRRCGPGRW